MKGLKVFLNKKELGLPIWAWALILAVVVVVFMKLRSKSSASDSSDAATSTDTTGSSNGVDGSDGGGTGDITSPASATDDSGELTNIDNELSALLNAGTTADTSTDGGGITPTSTKAATTKKPKTNASGIWWAGKWYTNWTELSAYLKTHGVNPDEWAAKHPTASKAIGHLPPTAVPQKTLQKEADKKAKKQKAAEAKAKKKEAAKQKAAAKKQAAKAKPVQKKAKKTTPKKKK